MHKFSPLKILISCILLIITLHSFAQEQGNNLNERSNPLIEQKEFNALTQLLSIDDKNKLLDGQVLSFISKKNENPRLKYLPALPLFGSAVNFILQTNPHILYESLFFLAEEDIKSQDALITFLSNQLRNVPILASIEYQNLNDGNIHPLFNSSEVITSPDDETSLAPLPQLTQFPTQYRTETSIVKQAMPPFGDVLSVYNYKYNKYYSEFIGTNLTNINYKNIRAVKPNNMFTSSWIILTEKGILIYGIGAVKIHGIASIFDKVISNSFSSRMVGLFKWLNDQISKSQQDLSITNN